MNIKIILPSLLLAGAASMSAQTAEWLVPPRYDSMELCAPDIYKVSVGGKMGLITTTGQIILSPEHDVLYDFYEGLAVFGELTNAGTRIKGVVSENGTVSLASGDYYLNQYYPFYSDGFIPVTDYYGYYGFLDTDCRPAFKFSEDETRPFSEGLAAVGEGDNFHYLTTSGEKIFLSLPNGSYPYGGTNLHNGVAYMWDEYGEEFFTYNSDGRILKAYPRSLDVDYLYRVDSGKGVDVEYSYPTPIREYAWDPIQKNGKWTFQNSRGILLTPYQYESVDYFCNGTAKAMSNGRWGLLHMVADNSTFSTRASNRNFTVKAGKAVDCAFSLDIPEKWQGRNLSVIVRDPDTGERLNLRQGKRNEYLFSYAHNAGKTRVSKNFNIEVLDDDISIWTGSEEYSFAEPVVKPLKAYLTVKPTADGNDRCIVSASIKNESSETVVTTVTLSGGGSKSIFSNKTVQLTIPPHSSRSVSSHFVVKKVELSGWCKVTSSAGGSAQYKNLELKPH